MNLEYKYRAKCINNNEWHYGTYLKLSTHHGEDKHYILSLNVTQGWSKYLEVVKETVGMFTGIYDSKNMEIFAGDVLVDELGRDWIVYFSEGGFRCSRVEEYFSNCIYKIEHGLSEPQNTAWTHQSCKIIGNIYDNPELKEGVKNED